MPNAAGIAKLRLFIEIKDKLDKGLDAANKKIKKVTGELQSKLNDFKVKNVEAFDAITSRVPGAGRALSMLANPYTLLAAAAIGAAMAIGKATAKAMEFEHTFMNIRQLNLDKSRSELDRYRKEVIDTAFQTGINLDKMTVGYYDLQSGLGIYGKEVTDISKQVARYSISTQADYNDSVNQTIKSMKAFGLQSKDTRQLLEANAKTVQVGIVTYAELAQVQTEYAGAAAAAGQNVDTANKFFAAFTSISKNADIAANKTKTAFQGLSDPRVLDNLQKYGVQIYDSTGKMRQLDQVIRDASGKIDLMNDKQFNKFMGDVGGPEGLRDLFAKLRNGADDFFKTLDAYDGSAVNLDKMYQNAMNDPKTVINMIREQFNTAFTRIGVAFMPVVVKIINGIQSIGKFFRDLYNKSALFRDILSVIGGVFEWAFKIAIAPIKLVINYIRLSWGAIIDVISAMNKWFEKITGIKGGFSGLYNAIRPYLVWVKDFLVQIGDLMYDVFTLNIKGAKDKIKNFKLPDLNEIKAKIKVKTEVEPEPDTGNPTKPSPTNDNPTGFDPSSPSGDVKTISNGSQTKNIPVNIDSIIKGFTPTNQSINGMNEDELERWMTEMFLRVVRSAETAM